jgi:hypothetical protein
VADRVKPLKIESPDTGGTEVDFFPTSINKNEDFLDCRGVTLQDSISDDDSVKIHRAPSGDMLFRDLQVPGGEHTLTELYLSAMAGVQEVLFSGLTTLLIDHQLHHYPLVQVIVGAPAGWNTGGWQNVLWNGDTSGYIRLPDDQYVTTHESEDLLWIEFASPLTGRVLYF